MRLSRTGETVSYEHAGKTYNGNRGLLVVGPIAFDTIENADTLSLTPDQYECEFGLWTARSGKQAKAIRILLTQVQFERIYPESERARVIKLVGPQKARGRIYVHPANHPSEVQGCIAPGLKQILHGVGDSVRAMDKLFAALGGWRDGVRIPGGLEVA